MAAQLCQRPEGRTSKKLRGTQLVNQLQGWEKLGAKDKRHMTDPTQKLREQMAWNASQSQGWALTEAKPSCDTRAAKWPCVDWSMSAEFWATLPKAKAECSWAKTSLKRATGYHGEGRLPYTQLSQPHAASFFSMLPSGHFIIFRAFFRNGREKEHHCTLPRLLQKDMAERVRLESMDACSITAR